MCMCACASSQYLRTHARAHTHKHTHTHTHTHADTCVYTHVALARTHARTRAHTHTSSLDNKRPKHVDTATNKLLCVDFVFTDTPNSRRSTMEASGLPPPFARLI